MSKMMTITELIKTIKKEFITSFGKFTDPRDGKTYKTVKIGNQVWMAENLAYNAKGSRVYKDDPANGDKYGRLYDWYTAMKACPPGWHLPSEEEWRTLIDFAGGEDFAGEYLKAASGWNDGGKGIDKFGFAALPGGVCYSFGYYAVGNSGEWWSATEEHGTDSAYYRYMNYYYENVFFGHGEKSSFFSVRCVRD